MIAQNVVLLCHTGRCLRIRRIVPERDLNKLAVADLFDAFFVGDQDIGKKNVVIRPEPAMDVLNVTLREIGAIIGRHHETGDCGMIDGDGFALKGAHRVRIEQLLG